MFPSILLEAALEGTAALNTALQQISEQQQQQQRAARFDAADMSAHCSANQWINDCSQTISIRT